MTDTLGVCDRCDAAPATHKTPWHDEFDSVCAACNRADDVDTLDDRERTAPEFRDKTESTGVVEL